VRSHAAIAGLASTVLAAGRTPSPSQSTPLFRTRVDYVTVDVIVTGKSDKPVTDLTTDEFVITENKKVQTIRDFQFVSIPAVTHTVEVTQPAPPPPPDVVTNVPPSPNSRLFAIVIDDLHIIDVTVLAVNLDTTKVAGEFLRPRQVLLVPRSREGVQQKLDYQVVTTVDLRPGKYQLRVSAKSARLGKAGSVYDVVDVPDYTKTPISIGALVLGYADPTHRPVSATPIDADTLPFEPALDRAFARADALRLFCEIWRRDSSKTTTTRAELLDAQGQLISTMDGQQPASRPGGPLANLDVTLELASLPPGVYQLRVTATDGTNTDAQRLGLVVR
jgi:hypothetical protein